MNRLIRRLIFWWAAIRLTPEDHAVLAWSGQGLQGSLHRVYQHLFGQPEQTTRALALTGHALACRHQN